MNDRTEKLKAGLKAVEQKRYSEAIALLEAVCQECPSPHSAQYVNAQVGLTKAYYYSKKFSQAAALGQQLVDSPDPKVRHWAQQVLQKLNAVQPAPVKAAAKRPISSTPSATAANGNASKSAPDIERLYVQARTALKQKDYSEAVKALEAYCDRADTSSHDLLQAKLLLVKAYKGNGNTEAAAKLCQELSASQEQMVRDRAQQLLPSLLVALGQEGIINPAATNPIATEVEPEPSLTEVGLKLKTLEDLKKYYYKHLLADLASIEKERQGVLRNITMTTVILAIAAISISFWVKDFWIIVGVLIGSTIAWVFFYSLFTEPYGKGFKRKIIEKIVRFIDPKEVLRYSHLGNFYETRSAFVRSTLFGDTTPDRLNEDDTITGKLGKTDIFFSEICAEMEYNRGSDPLDWAGVFRGGSREFVGSWGALLLFGIIFYIGRRMLSGRRLVFSEFFEEMVTGERSRKVLFKGIFFRADFNKYFKGNTVVLPDRMEKHLGLLSRTVQSWNKKRGQLIQLEDPEFERYFAVYGDDQIEARYILSTSLMERLTRFRKRVKRDIYISFVDNSIYIAIAYVEDLFEPKIFSRMLSFVPISEYFEILQMAIGIVEELNLNRRIWTRQ